LYFHLGDGVRYKFYLYTDFGGGLWPIIVPVKDRYY